MVKGVEDSMKATYYDLFVAFWTEYIRKQVMTSL